MLHYVHQLVFNFVCLLFGKGQLLYNVFGFFFCFFQLFAAPENNINVDGGSDSKQ